MWLTFSWLLWYSADAADLLLLFSAGSPPNIEKGESKVRNPLCPLAVQKATGIFRDKVEAVGFENTVLLTAANFDYFDMLQNWEFLASEQQLQWAVLAMDDRIFQELGEERAVPTQVGYAVDGAQSFRQPGFNKLSCNKMRHVLHIMETCQVDVVFSDCDNIFLQNPFRHEFGKMILSEQFEYIYQPNDSVPPQAPRNQSCLKEGKIVREGNTGFYFMSHRNEFMKQVIRDTLNACEDPKNAIDDQDIILESIALKTPKRQRESLQQVRC